MTRPVSIVLPSLGTRELLAQNLPALLAETARRAAGDEVIVVDDTGRDELSAWMAGAFPSVLVAARPENGGFARALLTGVQRARHEIVFSMNTDVRVRPGFLEPLVAHLADEAVAAAVPRVLLDGDETRIESLTEMVLSTGRLSIHMIGFDPADERRPAEAVPVAFAVGGTCLLRRAELLAAGGFDPLYEPFYWEDVDYCWAVWRRGGRIVYEPAAVVEHHHRGTIGAVVPKDVVRAAIEKNTLLFHWKNVDDSAVVREHLAELRREAVAAFLEGRAEELVWLNLALDQLDAALAARAARGPAARSFAAILAAGRPPAGR
ncbi:MAG: glycosyltransferase family 2 protein [Planctomycetota bacterium]